MEIRRGRAATIDADQAATEAVVDAATNHCEPVARVWCPHRQLVFGRRDARSEGYGRAQEVADQRGFRPTTRDVGGRAVAFSGETVAFVHAVPVDDVRGGIQRRYEAATEVLLSALAALGVDAQPGEPPDSFCPGSHSVQADGKLAGLAQRVTSEVAVVAGVVLVADRAGVVDVLEPVYDCLAVPFDPDTVGCVATAGGPADPAPVVEAIATAIEDATFRTVAD
jgi:lipoate-protein ligase A